MKKRFIPVCILALTMLAGCGTKTDNAYVSSREELKEDEVVEAQVEDAQVEEVVEEVQVEEVKEPVITTETIMNYDGTHTFVTYEDDIEVSSEISECVYVVTDDLCQECGGEKWVSPEKFADIFFLSNEIFAESGILTEYDENSKKAYLICDIPEGNYTADASTILSYAKEGLLQSVVDGDTSYYRMHALNKKFSPLMEDTIIRYRLYGESIDISVASEIVPLSSQEDISMIDIEIEDEKDLYLEGLGFEVEKTEDLEDESFSNSESVVVPDGRYSGDGLLENYEIVVNAENIILYDKNGNLWGTGYYIATEDGDYSYSYECEYGLQDAYFSVDVDNKIINGYFK